MTYAVEAGGLFGYISAKAKTTFTLVNTEVESTEVVADYTTPAFEGTTQITFNETKNLDCYSTVACTGSATSVSLHADTYAGYNFGNYIHLWNLTAK